ncbi:MAG: ABC transporter substrate-binding protein [Treponema sp.]|jgi:iron complex transport system substrate-binding protein|nr:ABC transporter substrate-binding protein [Treponema sp.]
MKQKQFSKLLFIMLSLVLAGCSQNSKKETITDRSGAAVDISGKKDKIISTAPSNTEILIGLGLGDRIIAADKYSAGLAGIANDIPLIDFAFPDAEAIITLNPDIIIATGLNQMASGDDPFKLVRETGIAVVYIPTSNSIDDIYEDIRFIAGVFGVTEKGDEITGGMKKSVGEIAEAGAGIQNKKSVYFEVSPAPFIVTLGVETYINQMIEIIGAQNIFADVKGWFSPGAEEIIKRNPDVILSSDSDIAGAILELKSRPGFDTITAVRNNAVYSIDVDSVSRPTQNIITALRQMAKAVYPEVYENFR